MARSATGFATILSSRRTLPPRGSSLLMGERMVLKMYLSALRQRSSRSMCQQRPFPFSRSLAFPKTIEMDRGMRPIRNSCKTCRRFRKPNRWLTVSLSVSEIQDPLNFAFLSKPVRLGEPRSPDGRRREHSRPDNLIFSSPRSTRLTRPTRRFWNHSQTSARASQPDNLTFPSPELGKVYPSGTAIVEATVGRRREPPSQTNSSFPSARTTISNSVERYVPGRSGNLKLSVHSRRGSTIRLSSIDLTSDAARASRLDNLTFSSYVSEANPSNRRARPPVGCRLSIPTKTLPFRLHLSDTVSLDLPSDAGASSPARHPYLF